jgi:hypothetical protein
MSLFSFFLLTLKQYQGKASYHSSLIQLQIKIVRVEMTTSVEVNPRLLANIRDEPKQMLQPISGYEHEPLLSLEKACQPLENILGNKLKQNIIIAKMNSTEPADGLTQDESASIHLYTMEWNQRENSLYAVLNQTLCAADRNKLRPWFKYLKLFLTAFFKLP